MPTLKHLTCNVEWSTSNIPLQEFQTSYADGFVETYIAVPAIPTPFSIHLRSHGYIAPGLAMFVYMDGEYQCNRNRTNLKIPDGTAMKKQTSVDFLVRQKEEITADGSFRGKQWRFGTLDIVPASDSQPQHLAPHNAEYLGTIEVVVLRCYSSEAHVPAISKKIYPKSPPLVQSSKPTSPKAIGTESSPPSSDDEFSSSSSSESVMGGLFDGGSDSRRSTSANHSFGRDGRWDSSTPKQGQPYQWEPPTYGTGSSSARVEGSHTNKQPTITQDYDTPEIDRPDYWKTFKPQPNRNSNNGKDRDRHYGNSKKSPVISNENQNNRSSIRGTPRSHPSAASPAVVINVNHTPQPSVDWAQIGPSLSGSNSRKNRTSDRGNVKTDLNREKERNTSMPGGWENTDTEGSENASWDNNQNHGDSYWNEVNHPIQHDRLDKIETNNALNWDNSSLEVTYNEPNAKANQDTDVQEWEGSHQEPDNSDAWNSKDKYAATGWGSYPNNNSQQNSAKSQTYTSNQLQPPVSPHPNYNQSTQQDAYGATKLPVTAPKPWQQPVEAPGGQDFGTTQPQLQPYIEVSSNPLLRMDPRPKPHWLSWKQSIGAFSTVKPLTPPVETIRPLYSVPFDIAQRKNMSHQVHLGQPAAYVHKRASPKYMDSFESPYAVFVFKYRSKAILEQLLKVPLHEPEAEEKRRLLSLSKEELVEHVLKGKHSSESDGTAKTAQSRSSSASTIKPAEHDHSNPAIPQFDYNTAQANPVQPLAGHVSDNASTNPSYHWDRNTPNSASHKQSYIPEVPVNDWINTNDTRGGSGNHGNNPNHQGVYDGTNWHNHSRTPTAGNGHPSTLPHHQSPAPYDDNHSGGPEWNKYGTSGAWAQNNNNNNTGQNYPNEQNATHTPRSWNHATVADVPDAEQNVEQW